MESWYVGDIGIALSYLIQGARDPLETTRTFVSGYQRERGLSLFERVFIPLMIQLRASTRAIESSLDGGTTPMSDIKIVEHFNDISVSSKWVNALL
jgi:Ser/Thr protein kinase RdoA (MazF antagonist)